MKAISAKVVALRGEILPPLDAEGSRRSGGLVKREQATLHFTRKAIDALPAPHPSGKQRLYWDDELKGWGVLVSGVTATKTFIVQDKLPGGKTRRVTVGAVNVLDIDAARDRAKKILAQMALGEDPKAKALASASEKLTLQNALDAFLETKKGKLRDSSKTAYQYSFDRYLSGWLKKPLRAITVQMVRDRHKEIQTEIEERGSGTGAAAANAAMRALRAVWNHAAKRVPEGAPPLPYNPVSRLSDDGEWHVVRKRERLVRTDSLKTFYQAVDELENRTARDYIKLLLFTGLRRREAATLQWDDLEWTDRLIRIPAARTKAGRTLNLPMSDFVYGLLSARKKLGRENEFVFAASSESGHLEEPKSAFALVAKASGINVSAHDLRRTFVTQAGRAGISPLMRKALVNHAMGGSDITEGYDIIETEDLREPAQKVADRLKELCGIKKPKKNKARGDKPLKPTRKARGESVALEAA